ncbi:MAG: transglutaminase domain-containing protein [Taibaiella sp.]|nr:transglutaminase domain-containing protein [Taibaiella sp.]
MALLNIKFLSSGLRVLPALLLLTPALHAQQPDTALLSRVKAQYSNENAVIINSSERLIISYDGGELTAISKIKKEKLLIGDYAPANDNYDYVFDDYFDKLTQFDAIAYTPKKGGGFTEDSKYQGYSGGAGGGISEARSVVAKFTGLKSGSFVRVTATQEHPVLSVLPVFEVSEGYPVLHGEFEVVAPEFVQMKFVMKGENTSLIKQSREKKEGNIIYRFTIDNLPGHKSFDHVPSGLYYNPQVIGYIHSFRLPGQTKDSLFLSDAEHLYKNQYKYVGNLNVKDDTTLKKMVKAITKGDVTDRQKAEHIYDWVQKNMHYIAFEIGLGGWIPREADTVCKKMYGDCKDMSSVLMKMGRMAGLKTYFAWIGTNYKPYTFEETPIPMVSNHMICALQLGNEWLFMDGTHANLPFGANRDDIQGKQAMVAIDKDNFKIVTIPVVAADKNITVDNTHIRISEDNYRDLKGSFNITYQGYKAWNLAYHFGTSTKDKEEREKDVTKITARGSNKYELDKYSLKMTETGDKEMAITGDFNIGGYVNNVGKEYIINMNLLRHFADDYIDTNGRKAAWYHDFKNNTKEVVVLDIPAGYKVTHLPRNAQGKFNDMWNYSITYKTDGKTITLTKEYTLNTLTIAPHYFAANNKAVKELDQQYKESVVLTAK